MIQSPSTKGNSVHTAQLLQLYFMQNNLEATLDRYKQDEANVYLKLGPPNTPICVLGGHLDVVSPGDETRWTHPPYGGEIIDGELWGRGSVDMKGGLAVLAETIVELSKEELKQQILFIATAEKETGLYGSKRIIAEGMLKENRVNYMLIAEPTGLQPLVKEKGVLWLKIIAVGKPTHGSRPDLGINAVDALMKILELIPGTFPETEDELLGGVTMSITTIQGGDTLNVGAESATVTLDIRVPPGVENLTIQQAIQDLLASFSHEHLQFSMETMFDEPAIIGPSNELAKKLAMKTWELTGKEPDIGGAHYTTDGTTYLKSLLEPVSFVIFGPGSPELLHQTDERVKVSEMFQAKTIISNTLRQLLVG